MARAELAFYRGNRKPEEKIEYGPGVKAKIDSKHFGKLSVEVSQDGSSTIVDFETQSDVEAAPGTFVIKNGEYESLGRKVKIGEVRISHSGVLVFRAQVGEGSEVKELAITHWRFEPEKQEMG